jgi:hemoglobin-like flavoprotein
MYNGAMVELDRDRLSDFSDSLGRCQDNPAFISRFYDLFIAASPEAAEKFRDTDFERQRRAMSSSLYALVLAMEGGRAASLYLDRIARQHGRKDLGIRPELYEVWLECLIEAVKECDSQYSDEIERLWRDAMAFGIGFMQSRY